MVEIFLDETDKKNILRIAKGRHNRAIIFNRKPTFGSEQRINHKWDDNLLGVIGEYAFAKYFSISYDGNGEMPDDFDVGGVQIRTTYYITGKLIMHETEKENRKYVLVWGDIKNFKAKLLGWTNGYQIKQSKNWGDHFGTGRNCFAVSQYELYDINKIY